VVRSVAGWPVRCHSGFGGAPEGIGAGDMTDTGCTCSGAAARTHLFDAVLLALLGYPVLVSVAAGCGSRSVGAHG
jgi:hypothetical protein